MTTTLSIENLDAPRPKFELRPYQVESVDKLRTALTKHKCVVLRLDTGAGKTVVAGRMMQLARGKNSRVLVLCHRQELINQFYSTLEAVGLSNEVRLVGANQAINPTYPIQVASIQTLHRRLTSKDPVQKKSALGLQPDLIIVDECHHAVSKTWHEVIAAYGDAQVVGLTATPTRLDGKGLSQLFEEMIDVTDIATLIKDGYLAPIEHLVPEGLVIDLHHLTVSSTTGDYNRNALSTAVTGTMMGNAVKSYQRYTPGKRAIFYGIDRKHSTGVAERFKEAGINAEHFDAKTKDADRAAIIDRFRMGQIDVLCNVDLISEGFDMPDCQVVIMGRPTMSMAMFRQQAGRCMRPKSDGSNAILLDLVNNFTKHGKPDNPHEWTLLSKSKGKNAERVSRQRQCRHCFKRFSPNESHCPRCGAEYVTKARKKPSEIKKEHKMMRVEELEQAGTEEKPASIKTMFFRDVARSDGSKSAIIKLAKEYNMRTGIWLHAQQWYKANKKAG